MTFAKDRLIEEGQPADCTLKQLLKTIHVRWQRGTAMFPRHAVNPARDGRRADERDRRDVRVGEERVDRLAIPRDDVQDARREARLAADVLTVGNVQSEDRGH